MDCWGTRSFAQVVINPVFDRTDSYKFRLEKVVLGQDTTFLYCTFKDEGHSSWINISKDTFLEDISSGMRYPLLKVYGLPYSPEKKYFTDSIKAKVILYFPHIDIRKFNIIEGEGGGFNIYGIDLAHSYESSFTDNDIIQGRSIN